MRSKEELLQRFRETSNSYNKDHSRENLLAEILLDIRDALAAPVEISGREAVSLPEIEKLKGGTPYQEKFNELINGYTALKKHIDK